MYLQRESPQPHARVHLLVPFLCAILAAFWLPLASPASAQDPTNPPPARDYVSCGHFENQESAQAVLDSGNLDENGRQSLDADGDGIACEDAFGLDPDSPPPARDYTSCGHFDSQASAQETLDSGILDELGRQSLDGDADGIACEDAFGTDVTTEAPVSSSTTVSGLPRTGSGQPQASDAGHLTLASILALSSAMAVMGRKQMSR